MDDPFPIAPLRTVMACFHAHDSLAVYSGRLVIFACMQHLDTLPIFFHKSIALSQRLTMTYRVKVRGE